MKRIRSPQVTMGFFNTGIMPLDPRLTCAQDNELLIIASIPAPLTIESGLESS